MAGGRWMMPHSTRLARALAVSLLAVGLVAAPSAAAPVLTSFRNPVSKGFADTFADPSVIRGKDGWWYAYGTTDPLREGERTRHLLPISRSRDLVSWHHVADAFTETTLPAWADPDAALWGPDIRYVDGQYRLYYVVTQTTVTPERDDNAIGVAFAPTPVGPWTDSGGPVVGPRRRFGDTGDFLWTFDPAHVTDKDGTQYLFYGSYSGGIFVSQLDATGTRAVGEATMVATDNRYEGAYVLRRGGYWYLFASSADCCAGPTTGYSVYAGRSRDVRGPYVDAAGVSLTASRVGGTIVIAPNGNRWVGTGHNAVVTDLAGQTWLAYHAIDRGDPYLDEPFGINQRPMLLDRLDWQRGWPTVRGGRWASEGTQAGPVTTATVAANFTAGLGTDWRATAGWTTARERDSDGYAVRSEGPGEATLLSRTTVRNPVRAEADLRQPAGSRGASGLLLADSRRGARVTGWLDAARRALVLETRVGSVTSQRSAPLPGRFRFEDWHSVVVELDRTTARAEVSDARLGDPLAVVVDPSAPVLTDAAVGAASRAAVTAVDNVSATRLDTGRGVRFVQPAEPGPLDRASSDEFNGAGLRPGWSWVREPAATVTGGVLRWPTQAADLFKDSNTASVLLRDAPSGDWTIQTKLAIDLGTVDVRNFQQGGLVVYANDDSYTKLVHVAIWNTRQTEFAKEMPFADGIAYGGTLVGPPADVTWLRLTHRLDPRDGRHRIRAATSRDGREWVHGGIWTLPAGAQLRVGLVSFGGEGAVSQFDYFRLYRP